MISQLHLFQRFATKSIAFQRLAVKSTIFQCFATKSTLLYCFAIRKLHFNCKTICNKTMMRHAEDVRPVSLALFDSLSFSLSLSPAL